MAGVIAGTLVCLGWCLVGRRLAPQLGLVDNPAGDASGLKVHSRPVAIVGGIGVFLGFHTGLLVEGSFSPVLAIATMCLLILGLLDDRKGLAPTTRLIVEVGAGVLIGFESVAEIGVGQALARSLLVVLAINAVNLLDGLDGLAGSIAAVSAIGIFVLELLGPGENSGALILVGCLGAFLLFNWHEARIFLGDHGSYTLGAFLCWSGWTAHGGQGSEAVLAVGGILGFFAIDLAASLIRRSRAGTALFAGDRSHVYDQLNQRCHSIPLTVLMLVAAQVVTVSLVLFIVQRFALPGIVLGLIVLGIGWVATLGGFGFLTPPPARVGAR